MDIQQEPVKNIWEKQLRTMSQETKLSLLQKYISMKDVFQDRQSCGKLTEH